MAAKPKETGGTARNVLISPPAHVIRAQTGTAFPTNPARWIEATGAVLGGTAVSAIFITAMPANTKWLAALLTGGLGLLLTTTSPIGTWAQEIGMGAAAASMAWLYFDVTGQIPAAAQTSAAAVRPQPVAVNVARVRRAA